MRFFIVHAAAMKKRTNDAEAGRSLPPPHPRLGVTNVKKADFATASSRTLPGIEISAIRGHRLGLVGASLHQQAASGRRSRMTLGSLPVSVIERRRNAPTWRLDSECLIAM